jgi:hypothetical protein
MAVVLFRSRAGIHRLFIYVFGYVVLDGLFLPQAALKQQKSRGGVALVMQATSSQCLTRCCTKVNASFTAWWAAEDQKWEPQREKEGIGALVSWS